MHNAREGLAAGPFLLLPTNFSMMLFRKREPAPAPPFVHAYDDDFDTLINDGLGVAIVDFWAPWCAPCRMMDPILGEIAIEFQERGVRVLKVDTDQAPQTAEAFGIRTIPTLIFFKDGEPLFEMVGPVPKPVLERELRELLGDPGAPGEREPGPAAPS